MGTAGNNTNKLALYKFKSNETIMGTIQLDTLINQDETISKELETLNTTGTKTQKAMIVVPIESTLLYIEPVYQITVNEENKVPILKKVIVASGNKIAIGDTLNKALTNLLSQQAVSVELETDDLDEVINQIINANNNLEQSTTINDWSMIGNDLNKLQSLIKKLEEIKTARKEIDNTVEENNTVIEEENVL